MGMSRNEPDTVILEYQIARTPEQKQAWCEKWAEDILRELGDWIAGENDTADLFEGD